MALVHFSNPKTKWARERLKQHGWTLRLSHAGIFQGQEAINVTPLHGVTWRGWFTREDADWTIERDAD